LATQTPCSSAATTTNAPTIMIGEGADLICGMAPLPRVQAAAEVGA
jgi:hypothetical protein